MNRILIAFHLNEKKNLIILVILLRINIDKLESAKVLENIYADEFDPKKQKKIYAVRARLSKIKI